MEDTTLTRNGAAFAVLLLLPMMAMAQGTPSPSALPDTMTKVTVGGFVDAYYAFDFNQPASFDRAFTTQPARHDEFNVNLAFVEARLDAQRMRGRVAFQVGTSVQANYSNEPRNGVISGPELSRFVQEAVVGTRLTDNLWIDGGIFLSHIGMEGFVSRDNPMYTRSLVADYSPYYESGVKATWQATSTVSALFTVVNGWQNISETNSAKSVGVRVDYSPSSVTTLSYFNYLGDEARDSASHRQMRLYNGVGFRSALSPRFLVMGEVDYGAQGRASGTGTSTWHGGMLTGRYQATATAALVGRVESFADRDQVIAVTSVAAGLSANGVSLGIDVTPQPRVLWRSEFRGLLGKDAVFPKRAGSVSNSDAFVVTSLGVTF